MDVVDASNDASASEGSAESVRPSGLYAFSEPGAGGFLPARGDNDLRIGDDYLDLSEGDVVPLMWDEDVDCPLWSAGMLWSDADEFIEFGAPEGLARDLARWAAARQATGRTKQSDLEALRLLDRLTKAFDHRYQFVYRP